MTLRVTLFRDFAEDRRISMEVYADNLIQAVSNLFPNHCQVKEHRPSLPKGLGEDAWSMRIARYCVFPWQAWQQQGQINHILDHGYGHLLYVLDRRRTIVTVHDLIPLVRWYGGIPGLAPERKPWLNLFSFYALRQAKRLIATSKSTRDDLVRFCGCKSENISIIHYGIEEIFRVYSSAERQVARKKWNLPADGTLRVMISGSQSYKNQAGALKAFAQLQGLLDRQAELLKIGMPNPEWNESVRELRLENVTRCLGIVTHNEMPGLYNCIDLLLFPSLYEGFGRPPLEAMACGVPVVASNRASLPEVIGDAGLMCPPDDHKGLAEAMYAVLTNADLRRSLIERGLARARQFTWGKTAQKMLEVYEGVIKR